MNKLDISRTVDIIRTITIVDRLVETKVSIDRTFPFLWITPLGGEYRRVQGYRSLGIMQGTLTGLGPLRDSQENVLIRQVRVSLKPEVWITREVIF